MTSPAEQTIETTAVLPAAPPVDPEGRSAVLARIDTIAERVKALKDTESSQVSAGGVRVLLMEMDFLRTDWNRVSGQLADVRRYASERAERDAQRITELDQALAQRVAEAVDYGTNIRRLNDDLGHALADSAANRAAAEAIQEARTELATALAEERRRVVELMGELEASRQREERYPRLERGPFTFETTTGRMSSLFAETESAQDIPAYIREKLAQLPLPLRVILEAAVRSRLDDGTTAFVSDDDHDPDTCGVCVQISAAAMMREVDGVIPESARISNLLGEPLGLADVGGSWPGMSAEEVLSLPEGVHLRLIGRLRDGQYRAVIEVPGQPLPFPLNIFTTSGFPVFPENATFRNAIRTAARLGLRFSTVD